MLPRPRTEAIADLVQDWLPRQRWFSAKDTDEVTVTVSGRLSLPADGPLVEVEVISVEVGGRSATYQVPLTFRRQPLTARTEALVGTVDVQGQCLYVYDAPHDPAFVTAWLDLVMAQGQVSSPDPGPPVQATGRRQPGIAPGRVDRPSRVLGVEQSNTSVVVAEEGDPAPLIVKVFRVLQPGANPDVSVTSVLTESGCRHVPRLTGWLEGEWLDPAGDRARGHLASISEFFPRGRDAWREACVAVEEGRSFQDEAEQIGAATAEVHSALARSLPTAAPDERAVLDLVGHLDQRLRWSVDEVPSLAEFTDAAVAIIRSVQELSDLPRRQRIHGDLHLGQVLGTGRQQWMLLDFEGEPLRPLDDRNRLDFIHRDLAGMLRSFDYAAQHIVLGRPEDERERERTERWVTQARAAFLSGYRAAGGHDPYQAHELLAALELDKALYEVVYESRNRPSWVPIPLTAVQRLCARARAH
jgi:trehalose synthase-fused probable maltokinase